MSRMHLHIIQPAYFAPPHSRDLYKTRKGSLVHLTLPYTAALAPDGIDIVLTDRLDFPNLASKIQTL